MKDSIFILSEQHPESIEANNQLIQQTITIWLTKELSKRYLRRFTSADI